MALEAALGGALGAGAAYYLLVKDREGKIVEVPIDIYRAITDTLNQPNDSPDQVQIPRIEPLHISDAQIKRQGTWTQKAVSLVGGAPVWHGYDLLSTVANDYIEITWDGVDVWPRVRMGPDMGILTVYVDNMTAPVTQLDLYNTIDQMQFIPFGMDLVRGKHTARFVVSGNKNVASTSAKIEFNGIVVKFFKGSHQIFSYPESTMGVTGTVATASSSVTLPAMLENDSQSSTNEQYNGNNTTAIVANTDLISTVISLSSQQNVEVVLGLSAAMSAPAILSLFRDGVIIYTASIATGNSIDTFRFLDANVPAGNRTYKIQLNQTGNCGAFIVAMAQDGTYGSVTSSGAASNYVPTTNADITTQSASFTIANVADCRVLLFYMLGGGASIKNITLRRDSVSKATYMPVVGCQKFEFLDAAVPVGAHTWDVSVQSGTNHQVLILVVISNGGTLTTVITPPIGVVGALVPLPDLNGTGAAAQLVAVTTPCSAVIVRALIANPLTGRVGDATVTASKGKELGAGDDVVIPISDASKVYWFAAAGNYVSSFYVV